MIGVGCNHRYTQLQYSWYKKIDAPTILKFQIFKTIDIKKPVRNGKAYYVSSEMPCSHCAGNSILRADSTEIDNEGLFEFSERIFEYEPIAHGGIITKNFYTKDENGLYRDGKLSDLRYDRQNKKLYVLNRTRHYPYFYEQDIYDLKSNKVTKINGMDTIQSTYKRIKVYLTQEKNIIEYIDYLTILAQEQNSIVLLEEIWKITKTIVKEAYDRPLEILIWDNWESLISYTDRFIRKLKPETLLEIAEKTKDLNKKYYFVVGAGIAFSQGLSSKINNNISATDSTIKMGNKILSKMNLFLDSNEAFVKDKLRELRFSGDTTNCHPMQKTKGKIIRRLEAIKFGIDPYVEAREYCEKGK